MKKNEKIMIGKKPVGIFPIIIAGAMVNGRVNYNTLGCYGMITPQPFTVYIKSIKSHFTNTGIRETGWFSINIPSEDLVQKTDYVGLVSGTDTDKSDVFTTFFGKTGNAPMIEECPVNLLCRVIQTDYIESQPHAEIFIGEVEEVYVNGSSITDGSPDINKIRPLMIDGTRYMAMTGTSVGMAWHEGKALIRDRNESIPHTV